MFDQMILLIIYFVKKTCIVSEPLLDILLYQYWTQRLKSHQCEVNNMRFNFSAIGSHWPFRR